MNELHLFAGAGGGILGGMLCGHTTVCAVEIEDHPRQILLQRQRDGILPRFPIWDDVKTFDGKPWRGKVDVVCGGFPCQDISSSGRGAGINGSRSGLWMEMARIISEVQPRFSFIENSPFLRTRGLEVVIGDLAEMGYDARWCVLGGDAIGAPQRRERMWILADAKEISGDHHLRAENHRRAEVGNLISKEWNDARELFGADYMGLASPGTAKRKTESGIRLVVDGVASHVEQLAAIGNGQIPQVAALAWRTLNG